MTTSAPSARCIAVRPRPAAVHGWGAGDSVRVSLLRPERLDAVGAALARVRDERTADERQSGRGGAIARGMGRSYGDAAQLAQGAVLDMTELRQFRLDSERGEVTAEAGITIGELLHALVPAGWVVPVVPGTQHVTVGGAIASDIHGKNHGTHGTFGSHVQALGLMTSAGETLELEPGDAEGLFDATLGGMGLTGVILWARISLRAVSSPLLSVDIDRAADLDQVLALLSSPGGPHRVAWVDLLGPRAGRGVVTRAEHLEAGEERSPVRGSATVRALATVPERWPGGLVRESTGRAFNELWFRRAPRSLRGHVESFGSHMFPLDALRSWPRLYGPQGFLQYQFVVPMAEAQVLGHVIELLRRARVPTYLCVLKDMGPANGAPLSFPIAGWTITLDIPRATPGLFAALDRCDDLVAAAAGRVYLSKDARMRPEALRAMYPRLAEWQAVRDRADPDQLWRSDLAVRTGLVPS